MTATTVKIHQETKSELDQFREYKSESYDEVIQKVIFIAKKSRTEPEVSKQLFDAIEKARARIKQGIFLTEEQAKKRLGL
ncbi:MAG: hypothetical protein KKF89_03535 [Nanoarchaeota archaeon]|nr:hypothetical protein [Nanoarchaeota archaeon]MBU1854768.1 hypothetical protein [Nanoarchaeota archaeon]